MIIFVIKLFITNAHKRLTINTINMITLNLQAFSSPCSKWYYIFPFPALLPNGLQDGNTMLVYSWQCLNLVNFLYPIKILTEAELDILETLINQCRGGISLCTPKIRIPMTLPRLYGRKLLPYL